MAWLDSRSRTWIELVFLCSWNEYVDTCYVLAAACSHPVSFVGFNLLRPMSPTRTAWQINIEKLTVYRTSLPELFGLPADLRGAESSTSGVNFARMVIMKAVRKLPSRKVVR